MTDSEANPEDETLHSVDDENNLLANSTMLPNILDDMDLSPYAFRLYVRFKRRVNQNRDGSTKGSAYDSTKNLAITCKMSMGQVTKAKRELVAAGLIRIVKVQGKHGEWAKDHVTIVDIWTANKSFYANSGYGIWVKDDVNGDKRGSEARAWIKSHPELRTQLPNFIRETQKQKSQN